LEEHNLIDYSLLVGVVKNANTPSGGRYNHKAALYLNKVVVAMSSGKVRENYMGSRHL
jgi:hypothetical protein